LRRESAPSASDWWTIRLPISIFFGWITVATFANMTVALKVSGQPDPAISYVALSLAAILAAVYAYASRGNLPYLATLVWGLAGIFVANYDSATRLLAYAAIGASLAVTVATFAGRSRTADG